MTMEKGKGKIEELQNKLGQKLGSENVQIGGERKSTIFIKNIDGTTSHEDIENAIRVELKIDENEPTKILDLVKNQRDNQTEIIEIRKQIAETLVEMKNIKIGWISSHINPRKKY